MDPLPLYSSRMLSSSESTQSGTSLRSVWWRDGVIYQIYPRSYADSNGDGVGDLAGIRGRLDHLAWLGVDGIWLSPCFTSPMADFGYDVADYCDIDPLFGTLDDMDRLIAEAHERGIRVLLDWVPNHTSDRHPWFLESRASRANAKRDWYVWRDARPDGSPPNNWFSIFGGPAWEWDEATGQYYLHSFLREQPELNWRNPELVAAMHDVLRFWFERGVDGFRIDVVHRLAKDPQLRDNPPAENARGRGYGSQRHVYDENHPDVHALLRGVRRVVDAYPDRMLVGEVYLMDPAEVATYYGKGDELHLAFNFSFMGSPWSAERFRQEVERFEGFVGGAGWPNVVLSSHDAVRHASRYDDPKLGDARARLAAMMLLTLRGTPFLYYGEEIGMRNVDIPLERMRDPLAVTLHPKLSRDGCRTPMQWDGTPGGGFGSGEPWLPLGDLERNAAAQRDDPRSLLRLYRDLIDLRRRTPALHAGDYRSLPSPEGVFAWQRDLPPGRAAVALNFSDAPRAVDLGGPAPSAFLSTDPERSRPGGAALELGPAEGIVLVWS
jgi:glycosidase